MDCEVCLACEERRRSRIVFPLNVYYLKNDERIPFSVLWHLIDLWSPWSRAAIRHVIKNESQAVITPI